MSKLLQKQSCGGAAPQNSSPSEGEGAEGRLWHGERNEQEFESKEPGTLPFGPPARRPPPAVYHGDPINTPPLLGHRPNAFAGGFRFWQHELHFVACRSAPDPRPGHAGRCCRSVRGCRVHSALCVATTGGAPLRAGTSERAVAIVQPPAPSAALAPNLAPTCVAKRPDTDIHPSTTHPHARSFARPPALAQAAPLDATPAQRNTDGAVLAGSFRKDV